MGATPSPKSAATIPAYEVLPDLEEYLTGAIFGDLWGRDQLPLKMRSAVTLATLAVQGREVEMRGHIGYALNLGWSMEEIAEIFFHVLPYGGAPVALGALRVAHSIFKERGLL
jgi:4-carboxymuconolactone decarboxylase